MTATRGILAYGAHVPYRRLDRAAIRNVMGSGGGRGHRAVASFDQDTTTMGVEAARQALATTDLAPGALWFSTVAPAYLDKTNATTAHAALRLDAGVPALDLGGAARSAVGALRTALEAPGRTLVVAADLRCGLPTSTDEAAGGDAASAVLTGSDDDGPLLAEYLGGASATAEFVDRWRTPGDATSRTWEERFGEQAYAPLVDRAWADALAATGLDADGIDLAVVTGLHARATKRSGGRLGVTVADDRSDTIGNSGAAHPALLLADVLDTAETGTVVALVVLADGCDVLLFRTTTGPPPTGPPPRPPAGAATGSTASSAPATPPPAPRTCRRHGSASAAAPSTTWNPPRWPTPRAPSSRSPSTAWPTRPARRWCSPSSTSTAAAACRSSSPTSTPPRWRSAAGSP